MTFLTGKAVEDLCRIKQVIKILSLNVLLPREKFFSASSLKFSFWHATKVLQKIICLQNKLTNSPDTGTFTTIPVLNILSVSALNVLLS